MKRILALCDDVWHPAEVIEKGILPLAADRYHFEFVKAAKDILTPADQMITADFDLEYANGIRKYGGKLKPEYRQMWAEYICGYIQEFQDRGYEVQRISLQNEPKAVQTWDSCLYTAEEEKIFLGDYMYPTMQAHGYENIEIFIWDHNKERIYERVRDVVDDSTRHMVTGAALHWYSGEQDCHHSFE